MKSEPFYKELDEIQKTGVCMWAAAPVLHKSHPQISLPYCNKIVLDWIKERKYDVSYLKNA